MVKNNNHRAKNNSDIEGNDEDMDKISKTKPSSEIYETIDDNSLNKRTRAEHYEILYQKTLKEIADGTGTKKKTTIMVLGDLWKLANIEAAYQEISISDVIAQALIRFIKTENGD